MGIIRDVEGNVLHHSADAAVDGSLNPCDNNIRDVWVASRVACYIVLPGSGFAEAQVERIDPES